MLSESKVLTVRMMRKKEEEIGFPSFKNSYMLVEKPYTLRDGTSIAAMSRGKLLALR